MRTRQRDNGEHTWQQTPQHSRRHARNRSARQSGSNRAKEQRFGAQPSWCYSPVCRDLPNGSNRGTAVLTRFAYRGVKPCQARRTAVNDHRSVPSATLRVEMWLHIPSAVELWLHIASAVELWLMGSWAFRLRQYLRGSSPAASRETAKSKL